ncbi:MAG: TaqI-like C-terminal specificity domain-containing protein [Solirubrobacteraceae bacterium]
MSKEKTFTDFSIYESQKVEINVKEDEIWTISNPIEQQIKQKIETIGTPLKDWDVKFYRGTTTGYNDAFLIDESLKNKLESENINSLELIKPLLKGRDLMRYIYTPSNYYIITTYPTLKIQIQKYPAIEKHLSKFLPSLNQTGEVGCRKKTNHKWFEYSDTTSYFKEFEKEKIIFSKASKIQAFCYDDDYNIVQNTGYILTGNNLKYFLSFLNSKLAKYIFLKFYQSGGIQGEITIQAIENIPIPKICLEIQQPFIEKADLMLRLNKELQLLVTKFMTLLQSDFTIKKPTKKLENWYNLSWAEFEKELNKLKITLLGTQKEDWLDRFTRLKTQAISLKTEIDQTDKQIDAMVYELYGLTDEEIKIIENI